jgi:putative oxidoreductase
MNIVLWILQVLLAAAFLAHGWMFLAPPPDIAAKMNELLPRWFQLFLGVAEVAGGIGLILPGVTRILPQLVAWAADGIAFVLISATILHAVRGEISSAVITAVMFALAAFVAYQRHAVRPIAPRRAA